MKNLVYLFGILLAVVFLTAGANAQVVINEIQSRGVAGNLDWIEIYNPGDVAVNLGGYTIYDNGAGGATPTKPKKAFPASATIPAKGFYVIITDTADFTGDLSGFGLSSSGEKVWLHDTVRGVVVDTVTFGLTGSAAQTYGRGPDGGGWTVLNAVTRGTSNGKIFMNEVYSRGVAGNLDWIEIYSSVPALVRLGGYTIYDNGAGGATPTKPKKAFPASATIPANGFYVIITDTADFTGDPSGFGLSSSGEKVWLHDTLRGMIVDTVTFGATATAAQSYGRSPDGGAWQVLNTITRGATNGGSTSIGSDGSVATDFALAQNYPNPFNPSTTIRFSVARESNVRLTVFNLLGQPVATLAEQLVNAGTHSFVFEATNLPSGVYVYRLDAGAATLTRTMMLLK
ncbi:MAG: lamin tail domain-containing protein [Bacteroidetes bacterium]|nr:lamin tail domain-containing protein [Bacteroidota bacterium]